ncbi:MAG: gluconokinase [Turicibacter sp.]|nr:gluconokinase [Turicibacter sp.]
MNNYYIGVDLGTTSAKSVLFDHQNQDIATSNVEYPLYTPEPMIAELDPEEIYEAVMKTIREVVQKSAVDPEQIALVSFSCAMHSVIPIDEAGLPLMRAITWADTRASAQAAKLKGSDEGLALYQRTGTPIHAMSPLTKLLWLKEEKCEVFNRAHKFIDIKAYVLYKLFGEYVIDYSLASATGMFNLGKLAWDERALSLTGLTAEQLPTPVPTMQVMTGCTVEVARLLGVGVATRFVIGASDGPLSNLGLGAIRPGDVALTIGTSGAIRTVVDKPVTDEQMRTFCYALTEKHWVVGGAVNNGGIVLRWVRDALLGGQLDYEAMTALAEGVAPGADGLFFHPYLLGERSPLWDADVRGSFFGLGMHHQSAHLIRAALEGVMFNLYHVLNGLRDVIGEPQMITATGGFARSALWRQILADLFDVEVRIPDNVESSCLGAVMLGRLALGEVADLEELIPDQTSSHHHLPAAGVASKYRELIPVYLRLVEAFSAAHAQMKNL